MNRDLLFHVVSKRRWRDANKDGIYQPAHEESDEVIECVWPEYLNDYLNEHFRGRKNLLILVIDVNRLPVGINKQKEEKIVKAGKLIYSEAILDKIRIDCGAEGQFELDVHSK